MESGERWVTDWMAGIRFPVGASNFPLIHSFQTASETHLASYPMNIGAISPGTRRPEREAGNSIPSSTEAIPPFIFIVYCLIP